MPDNKKHRSKKTTLTRRLKLEQLAKRELLAADALSTWAPGIEFESTPLLGETVDVDVSFANRGDAVGYGPYVDVIVPAASGVDYVPGSASLIGNSVTEQIITFDEDGKAEHPLAETDSGTPLIVEGNAGDKLVVLTMPFGSFAPDQTALEVDIQVMVDANAEVGETLQLVTSGGFQYGGDALDNPANDPSILGNADQVELTPSVIKLEEYYGGPEHETTSGTNFVRSWTVELDIATGETLSNINLESLLDNNVAFQSVSTTSIADGTIEVVAKPVVGEAASDQSLSLVIPEMTGVDGADASFKINFVVPQHDANGEHIVSPVTGAGDVSVFTNNATADWTTQSESGPNELVVREVQATTTDQISDQAIAVQQSVRIVESQGSLMLSVGDVLEYTLQFQVSDYVAVQDLLLNMVVPDGQTYLGSETTEFTISGVEIDRVGGAMQTDNAVLERGLRAGEEHILFDISNEIQNRGGSESLAGGLTTHGKGTGVYGTITVRTVVDDTFAYDYASGDESLDEGDTMQSTVVATATMLDVDSLVPSAHIATDNSAEWMIMPTGLLQSELYAVNGETANSNEISAGDVVTFRIQRKVRGGDVESLVLNEFFPLPVFAIGNDVTFSKDINMSSGVVSLGPSDTFHSTHSITPEVTVNAASNQINFQYGNNDWAESGDLQIDLLVTATVQDQPFADGLLLTSQSTSSRGSTNYVGNTQMTMDAIVYTRPILEIVKGVAEADNPQAKFTGSTGNKDVQKIDSGDTVVFHVEATNVGSSDEGAHDVTLKDAIPTGFEIPADGLELQVTDGDGNQLEYEIVNPGGGEASWFSDGIRLKNALSSVNVTDGSNTVLVSYQLDVSDSVLAGETHSSEAEVVHYAALPGGTNYATTRIVDAASARIATPIVDHTLVSTDQTHTSGATVVVGEKATYQTRVAIPEGTMSDARIAISLYQGLAIDQIVALTVDDAIELQDQSVAQALENAQILNSNNSAINQARILEVKLGDLINTNRDNSVTEYITVQYTTTVLNAQPIQNNVSRRPVARVYWADQVAAKSGTNLNVAEPTLQVNKSYSDTLVDAGDKLTTTVSITHISASKADAFDLELHDLVPDGVTYVADSLRVLDGTAPDILSDGGDGEFRAIWSSLPIGETSRLQYDVIVNDDVHAGDQYNSTAQLQWTSLAGNPGQLSQTNSLAFERTGDSSDDGGSLNDYNDSASQSLAIRTPTIEQTIVASSADHTSGNQLTIGESVTLQVVVTVPEGVHDMTLEELLATDRGILDLQSVTLSSLGENLSSDQLEVGKTVLGSDSGNDGWGDMARFDLGTVTNVADGEESLADQIVFTVQALVVDVAENQAGAEVKAAAVLHYGSAQKSDADGLRLVEPELEASSAFDSTQLDAGDVVTITAEVQPSFLNSSEAISVNFQDLLSDTNLTLQTGSVQTSAGEVLLGNNPGDTTISIQVGDVDDGDTVKIQYQVKVSTSANPGDQLQSRGEVTWASLENGDQLRQYGLTTVANAGVNSTSLRGLVFVDFEQDGQQSSQDFGIGEVTIELSGVDHLGENVALTTNSLPGGLFAFEGLRPGDYQISQTQPYLFEDGEDYAPVNGGLVENDLIKAIEIPRGSNGDVDGYNFTEAASTWIEGTVYNDFDHNGILGQDEDGIEGVLIKLDGTSDEGEPIEREVLTNYRGYYVFGYLPSGVYSIKQQQPAGFFDADDQLGNSGGLLENDAMLDIELGVEQAKMYNFGEYAPSSIQGSVFVDYDRDNLLDRKDGLITGVAVKLSGVDYTGEAVELDTVTDIDGKYRFENLKPGTYDIQTESIDDLQLGTVNVGKPGGYDTSGEFAGEAVDYGFKGIKLTSGGDGWAYDVGHDDPKWTSSVAETEFAQSHFIKATPGNDTFDVSISQTQALVNVGGSQYIFESDETRSIVLLGSFGDDTANITGSSNKESVDIRPTSATVSGTWFQLRTYGTENFNFAGGGEEDLVRMYDDTNVRSTSHLITAPFTADYEGEGWHHTVQDIHRIYVYSYNDGDSVEMTGSDKRDNFFASHETSRMYDGDYYVSARGFDSILATANNDTDRANLYDSEGADHLIADADQATLTGEGYKIVVDNFKFTAVDGRAGGHDTGVLNGSSGQDRFTSRPTTATLLTEESRIIAKGFETLDANGNGGDADRAYLYDSHYRDTLTASPEKTVLENAVNVVSANSFDRVYSYSDAGGDDIANITGSTGDDKFHSYPLKWTMAGSGYYMFSTGFTEVAAYASDGFDRAYMYDSNGLDVFSSNPDWARMQGQRYSNEAHGFDKTYAYSSGGNDQAVFYDGSDSRSTVRFNGSSATVFGSEFSHNLRGFKGIDAFYSELSSRDRVELKGLQSIEMTEVDIEGFAHKLSLLSDADAERVDIRNSVDKL